MRLWCYVGDRQGWGAALLAAALKRKWDAHPFLEAGGAPNAPDRGVAFVHMHHHPQVRWRDKQLMAALRLNSGIRTIPDYRASILYDDKAAQAEALAKWMPETLVLRSAGAARKAIETLGLPLISKTSEGANAHNVRLIRTADGAKNEIKAAFGGIGIRCHYDQRQRGYLIWQRFCAGNDYDYRVKVVGGERTLRRRHNRADRPMASGSEHSVGLWPGGEWDGETADVLAFADALIAEEGLTFAALDILRDHERARWVLLETSVGWTMDKTIELERFVSGRPGADVWDVLLDEIEAGRLP